MRLHLQNCCLALAKPFSISRGTITTQRSVVVKLESEGHVGYGEVSENDYYGHTVESITESIEGVRSHVENMTLTTGGHLWNVLRNELSGDRFALSALDVAAQDIFARTHGRRCYEMWGLDWQGVPDSSLTLSLAAPEDVVRQYRENPEWKIYKIKLGGTCDLDIVRALREETNATLRIDANCAWSARETIENSHILHQLGVEFIEQPLAAEASRQEHALVHRESALPIVADESCCTVEDVKRCVEFFDGINVKLCKCGGLTPAIQMLREARSSGLRTMVGCMIESSIGISAAAQLLPLLDYADLDGATLLADDPAEGVEIHKGVVTLPDRLGCGAILRAQSDTSTFNKQAMPL